MALYTVIGWRDRQAAPTVDFFEVGNSAEAVAAARRENRQRYPDWRFLLSFAGKHRLAARRDDLLDAIRGQAEVRRRLAPTDDGGFAVRARRAAPAHAQTFTVVGFILDTGQTIDLLEIAATAQEALTLAEARTGGAQNGILLVGALPAHLVPAHRAENFPLAY